MNSITSFTWCTWASPSSTQWGTALGLQSCSIDIYFTSSIHYVLPTGTLDCFCLEKKAVYCHADCSAWYINILANTLVFNHIKNHGFIIIYHIRSKLILKALDLSFPVLEYSLKSSQEGALANPSLLILPRNSSTPFHSHCIYYYSD